MKDTRYTKLLSLSKATALLEGVNMLLDWDRETFMPTEAIALRSEQIELLASLTHRSKTGKGFEKALTALIDLSSGQVKDESLSLPQKAALREWRRDYLRAKKLPNAFVKRFANITSTATHVWQMARHHNDFKSFAPHLEKVVNFSRRKADILGFQEHPYDALLDLYEPEMKTSSLSALFARLKIPLKQLLKDINTKPQFPEHFLYRHYPKHQQLAFAHTLLHKMGFPLTTSRLDTSAHPFCTALQPKDVRMTTRIHPDNLMFSVGAVLHEGGHGLYHMHLPIEQYGSPLCEAVSLGIDESQSRWWEMLIGQSQAFWIHFYPLLQQEFPEQLGTISFQEFYHAINNVKPGLIRIEADEVTYNLHIIVRFEIEKGLIEGSLKVKEIPDAWNEKMRDYLGITPQFDGQGCLQDIHWSLGLIGYFPTYTLGNLYSVQFFTAFEKAHPKWQEKVAQGSLDFIGDWLKENIHQYGRRFSSEELCRNITGSALSETPYVHYLTQKYHQLYHIPHPS